MRKRVLIFCILVLLIGTSAWPGWAEYWPTAGWRSATPESRGMDSRRLVEMLDVLIGSEFKVDSILVIRHGHIVLEAYRSPFHAADARHLQSCSKSVLSALVGIAMDQGHLAGVQQVVGDLFPDHEDGRRDATGQKIELEHLLTMTHGLGCNDLYTMSGLTDMSAGRDWTRLILDLPAANRPGRRFSYCNGAAYLVSAVLQAATGMTALSFGQERLFTPLGIKEIHWPANTQGVTVGYNGLRLRPRDAAKIGYLYLKQGRWEGRQILPSQWVAASTRSHIATGLDLNPGYGYLWWVLDPNTYMARGAQGHYIMVAKAEQLVAVFTGRLPRRDIQVPVSLLSAYILPAVVSTTPLPEASDAADALRENVRLWQTAASGGRHKPHVGQGPAALSETYTDHRHGFTFRFSPAFSLTDRHLRPPVTVRRRGLRGLPFVSAVVDAKPANLALAHCADYLLDNAGRILPSVFHGAHGRIESEGPIALADGRPALLVDASWRTPHHGRLTTTAVLALRNDDLIAVVAGGGDPATHADLARIPRTLTIDP